jgi:hypothetical protein
MVIEVLGMHTGKTFQVIKLSERHTLKVVSIVYMYSIYRAVAMIQISGWQI